MDNQTYIGNSHSKMTRSASGIEENPYYRCYAAQNSHRDDNNSGFGANNLETLVANDSESHDL